ncbi:MAG: uncharacterized protein KVP18_002543 [Porospora cf. gigantea A]|uniref:uncharacterized protein n=1 Tax=Porospora cf. gigantea A TaxID=2853593 RepID=UPI00355A64AD|nr:MAG: hypothetical protein KVP18_002543 [Porospora cf. gigantea A]
MRFHPEWKEIDYDVLGARYPELRPFIFKADHGGTSVGRGEDPEAVRVLTKVSLQYQHGIEWPFPAGSRYMIPPVPSREVYVRIVNDLITGSGGIWADAAAIIERHGESPPPSADPVTGLDIGVGASAIYSLLGAKLYGWRMVGTDIDAQSLQVAQTLIDANPDCNVHTSLSPNPHCFFPEDTQENFTFSMCNPPFYASGKDPRPHPHRSLVGTPSELYCVGGESKFVVDLFRASRAAPTRCLWYTVLCHFPATVSDLKAAFSSPPNRRERRTTRTEGTYVKEPSTWLVIQYTCGASTHHIVAWTFH